MKQINIVQYQTDNSDSVDRLLKELDVPQHPVVEFHYGKAVLKTKQYEFFKENKIPHPEWTTERNVAERWIWDGHTVVCRNRIRSQRGNGIVLAASLEDLVDSKVYTKYIPKKREFRVNIFKDTIVNIREKVATNQVLKGAFYTKIRTVDNGYHTVKLQKPAPKGIEELAVAAGKVSESDFKGVDICFNEAKNYLFVLEVNSGPSIEGSSVKEYADAIRKELQ